MIYQYLGIYVHFSTLCTYLIIREINKLTKYLMN